MEAVRGYDAAAQLYQAVNTMTTRLILNNDTDGDGVLSVEELMVSEDIFARIDKNGDGQADREELNAAYPKGVNSGTSKVIQNNDTDGDGVLSANELGVTDDLFGKVDRNDDGQADSEELNIFYPQVIKHMITTLIQNNDTNGDGLLSADELSMPQDVFARIDQNDDGQASRKELYAFYPRTHHVTTQVIQNNDTNGNGVLSADELTGPQKLFEIIDANDDEQIDRKELNTFYPKAYDMTARLIEENDTDGDGVLSADELGAPEEMFAAIDGNQDGQVDKEELDVFLWTNLQGWGANTGGVMA